jgi:hypothetical protein
MPASNDQPADQQRIVALLAAECQMPLGEVAQLYEQESAALAQGAHNTKFLHIFAARNVLEVLRKRHLEAETAGTTKPILRAG